MVKDVRHIMAVERSVAEASLLIVPAILCLMIFLSRSFPADSANVVSRTLEMYMCTLLCVQCELQLFHVLHACAWYLEVISTYFISADSIYH